MLQPKAWPFRYPYFCGRDRKVQSEILNVTVELISLAEDFKNRSLGLGLGLDNSTSEKSVQIGHDA